MKTLVFSLFIFISLFLLLTCGTESTPIYTLTTSVSGEGTTTPSSGKYEEGETVSLTGNPSNGWAFVRWEGDWSSTQNPSTLIINGDKNIIGVFERLEYPLTITTEGEGSVEERIVSQPKSTDYTYETVVELTPVPANYWEFIEWSGDVESTDEVIEITIKGETNILVLFEFNGRDTETTVVDVTNPITGKIWMDRNLGASRAAESSADEQAYGDLYQWGRAADGHQKRNSPTTTTLSNTDQPDHGDFIITSSSPLDWRSPQNNNLWQGVNGVNNPCPVGYRIPTSAEWNAERLSWSSNNSAGAFVSPLKLPVAGGRGRTSGSLGFSVGSYGLYWSGSVSGSNAIALSIFSHDALIGTNLRANGLSVRCLKN